MKGGSWGYVKFEAVCVPVLKLCSVSEDIGEIIVQTIPPVLFKAVQLGVTMCCVAFRSAHGCPLEGKSVMRQDCDTDTPSLSCLW